MPLCRKKNKKRSENSTAEPKALVSIQEPKSQHHDSPVVDNQQGRSPIGIESQLTKEAENTSMKLESITDGENEHGVPKVKFVEDITSFANTFDPPASAELMIGAYSDLFAKFKTYEGSLTQKSKCRVV